jgi:predicted DNA-binding transcriptional regulator YafY
MEALISRIPLGVRAWLCETRPDRAFFVSEDEPRRISVRSISSRSRVRCRSRRVEDGHVASSAGGHSRDESHRPDASSVVKSLTLASIDRSSADERHHRHRPMNRAERIYKLHALLQDKPRSLAQMQQNLEVSRATVVRDLGYMKDFMGAPIEYDRPTNGYRYQATSPRFELPGFWLNESELYALLASARLFELVQPGLLAPYVGPLRARIRSLLGQSGHSVTTVDERILLQPFATRTTHPERFGTVASAVLEGHQLVIQYHGRERDRLSDRTVHPQRLLRYRDNWYLAAHCDQAAALRIFSLDRILRVKRLNDCAHSTDPKELERFLGASFGIFSGNASAWAVLRFTPDASRWVADETWHPDQIGQWVKDRFELQIPYSDPRELLMDILKYGPEVEVIAPPGLRTMVAERLVDAANLYADTQAPS